MRVALALALALAGALQPVPVAAAVATADLSTAMTARPSVVAVGRDVSATASVTNHGPEQASDVVLRMTPGDGLVVAGARSCTVASTVECSLGSVPPGASVDLTLTFSVVSGGLVTIGADVEALEPDPVPENDASSATVRGRGKSCRAMGTQGPDDLRGRGVVCGLGGDDVLWGGGRRDLLIGGSGHDVLVGGRGRDRLDGGPGRDSCARDGGDRLRACARAVFGMAGRLPLAEPTRKVVGYGYHQSLFRTAIRMRAVERHVVMGSRGRGTGSTTAVDVVIPSRARMLAPVTGTVVTVTRYRLYCRDLDWKVVIEPRSHPDLRVLVLHMARPTVAEDDEVVAGVTRIGRAQVNDGPSSQANRHFPARYPHVHIEVERDRASPTPGCAASPIAGNGASAPNG